MIRKSKPKTMRIEEITSDFTQVDWQQVEREKKYYALVVKLRELRLEIGLTQQELAQKANLPRATVVKVESGKRNATLDTLMHIAEAMGKELVVSLK